jgi:hypothetical protein
MGGVWPGASISKSCSSVQGKPCNGVPSTGSLAGSDQPCGGGRDLINRGSTFSVNDHDRLERERAEEQNRQLRAQLRRHEEQCRRQAMERW